MKNIIVDYKKLTPEILNLLVEKFPDGYGIRDIVKFTNHKGQYIEAVEVSTEDTKYLVKISNELVDSMEAFEDDDEDNFDLEVEVPNIDLDEVDIDDDITEDDDIEDKKEDIDDVDEDEDDEDLGDDEDFDDDEDK
ncbi:DNA primase [Lutibacter sp. HS1-25]|uniref:DNA primase n=1 Tax=Lutibacter sp. HS1-25 TaxID=2485000 RepID=UPI00101100AE|nr:DNA primase [Lutibacter sp. HS1-25]RXP45200.1 DNA primase [Lutibacter sp. HS1-25]